MSEIDDLRRENDRLQEMIARLEERTIDALLWTAGLFECAECYEPASGVTFPHGLTREGSSKSLDARVSCGGHAQETYRSFQSLVEEAANA